MIQSQDNIDTGMAEKDGNVHLDDFETLANEKQATTTAACLHWKRLQLGKNHVSDPRGY